MRKRKSTKSVPANKTPQERVFGAPDYVVFLICIAGVLFCLWFFRQDLNQSLTRLEAPMGTITFKYKAAQRRLSDRVLWDRLAKESPVYNGDLIRTADLSEATVTFHSGGIINLQENSIIQLFEENAIPRIDFTQGSVSVNVRNGEGIILSSGDSRLEVLSGGVVSAGAGGDGFTVSVVEGTAMVSGETLEAGAVFSDDTALSRTAPLKPRPATRLLVSERRPFPVQFRWNRVNYTETTHLEIAEDRGFTRPAAKLDLEGDEALVDLGPGNWWWRAYPSGMADGFEGGLPENITEKLVISYAPPPVQITPAGGYVYRYRTKQPSVRFQWTETAEAAFYIVTAANNPQLLNPVLQIQEQGTSFIYSKLPPGRWYWQVQPVFSGDYEGASAGSGVNDFFIEQSGELSSPVLSNPQNGSSLNISEERQDFYFSWNNNLEADSYTLRISRNRDLSGPLITRIVRDNYYVYRANDRTITDGQYYWGVYQTDMEGNASPLSPVYGFFALEGEVIQRTLFPPDNYTIAENLLPDMRFTWRSNLPFQTRFQVSSTPDFSGPAIDEVTGSETIRGRQLSPGTWYWRIAVESPEVTLQTAPKVLRVAPPLARPVMETPGDNSRIAVPEWGDVPFRWAAVPEADYYQFRLYRELDPARPVYQDNLNAAINRVINWSNYAEGNYFWTIQAFTEETPLRSRQSGLISSAAFSLRKLRPVALEYPATGAVLNGLSAYRQGETIRWSTPETLGSSRFILSQNPNPLAGRPVIDITNPDPSIPLARLREGTYFWTILGETPEGYDVSAPSPASFRVLPIEITPVSLNLPGNEAEFEGLAAMRRPGKLRWSSEEFPQTSRFVLSRNPDPLKDPLMDIRSPGAEISLVRLEAGEYYWTIRAETADGLDISAPSPASFRVLPIPPLPSPGGISPENAARLGPDQLETMNSITFSWGNVSGANA
ncbi:FecR domain-containing protein, partial [Treponema primitia]|uniref:FecR domain-containing protein n=1 Tax=Treponema primitia TaxID=88058 RepID=UPI0002554CD2